MSMMGSMHVYTYHGCPCSDSHSKCLLPCPFGLGYTSIKSLNIPWTTYTDLEITHVGMYE